MSDLLLEHEATLRLGAFLGVLAIMACLEIAAPRRRREIPRLLRWSNNIALVILDALCLRLLFPILAVGVALVAEAQGWGAFNFFGIPFWLATLLSLLILDLAIYAQHVLFHHVPILWRLHRMHHADLEIDVSTGLRFHPFEIILSMLIKMGVV